MFTVPQLAAGSGSPSLNTLNLTPCGESFFERDIGTTPSYQSANKETNDSATSGNIRKQSKGNNALQVAKVHCSSVSKDSVTPVSMLDDHTSKDSLLLTELLDSSDDEWANTSALGTDCGKKVSSASTGLDSFDDRFNLVESIPCNQQGFTGSSFQDKSTAHNQNCNSLKSGFSPQRINTIPNNGNDSKSAIWPNVVLLISTRVYVGHASGRVSMSAIHHSYWHKWKEMWSKDHISFFVVL